MSHPRAARQGGKSMTFWKLATAALGLALMVPAAGADDYPSKPIVWILPSAGTVSDNTARFMSPIMAEKLGQPVVVENKPGAGGIISFEAGAAAKPDGYTILFGSSGPLATYPFTHKTLSYDPVKSFEPIHGFGSSPLVLAVNASSPFKTFADLADYAKANPDKLNFGTVGVGSAQHLTTVLMMQSAGVSMTHIPYKATSNVVTDLLGGSIDLMFDFASVLKPQLDAGTFRALGVSGTDRLPALPDVPTFAEQGSPDIRFSAWSVLLAPAGTPKPIVDKLAEAFEATLKDQRVVDYHDKLGAALIMTGPEETKAYIAERTAVMKALVEKAGITPE